MTWWDPPQIGKPLGDNTGSKAAALGQGSRGTLSTRMRERPRSQTLLVVKLPEEESPRVLSREVLELVAI